MYLNKDDAAPQETTENKNDCGNYFKPVFFLVRLKIH